jgi:molecular chaperone IbpA|tara:strand:+ start:487 stop:903 length:417 start_codon:yes stop_codon:yes gene_type:complete
MTNLKVGKQLFPKSAFIGFDHLFNELEYATKHANDNYPPHNIIKESDDEFVIEVAVAGFKQENIHVEQKERSLTIKGESDNEDREVIHRGISTRNFKRHFRLSEYVQVTGASLQDGILAVTLKLEIPEEKQPRKIKIV